MLFFRFILMVKDPKFEEGEVEVHRAKRHWVILLQRMLIPLVLLVACVLTVLFRLAGGDLITTATYSDGQLDIVAWIIVFLLLALFVAFQRSLMVAPKNRAGRRNIVVGGALLLVYLLFHLSGGRLVSFSGPSSGLDTLNGWLIASSVVLVFVLDWIAFDWQSDDLILTNMRVIYEDYIPLIRDFREQIDVENVQSVVAKSDTYIQNFFGYGTVIIASAAQTKMIFRGSDDFEATVDPVTGFRKRVNKTQRLLQQEVDKRSKDRNPREFRGLIEKQVYGSAPMPAVPAVSVPAGWRGNWFFPQNPEIRNDKDRTIIWHKFWLFEILQLLQPLLTGLLVVAVLVLAYRNEFLGWGTLVALLALSLLVVALWSWYEVEDHRNDLYILTTSNIIDIEKKPLGPENRRQAGLGQVQNVNYTTTFIGNWLGYGNVIVETAGQGNKFTFERVPRPRDVATTINDYLNSFRQGDRERTLRESLMLLKAYHEAQLDHGELGQP